MSITNKTPITRYDGELNHRLIRNIKYPNCTTQDNKHLQTLDIRNIKCYIVSTGTGHYEERLLKTFKLLNTLGFKNIEFSRSPNCSPQYIPSVSLAMRNILIRHFFSNIKKEQYTKFPTDILRTGQEISEPVESSGYYIESHETNYYHESSLPFEPCIIFEDDIELSKTGEKINFNPIIELPKISGGSGNIDALFLGLSKAYCTINTYASDMVPRYDKIDENFSQIYGMLAEHAILYLSLPYALSTINQADYSAKNCYPPDVSSARTHNDFNILALNKSYFHQEGSFDTTTELK